MFEMNINDMVAVNGGISHDCRRIIKKLVEKIKQNEQEEQQKKA